MSRPLPLLHHLRHPLRGLYRFWMRWHLGDERYAFMWDAPPEGEWVSLDCETTGLNVQRDEIIAISAVRIRGNRLLTSERLELLIKPRQTAVNADAVRVHGLLARDLQGGLTADEALPQLLEFIGSRPLVGYFLEFDLAMLNRALFPLLGVPLPQARHEVSSMYHAWRFAQQSALQQQVGTPIDLRFDSMMDALQLPRRPAHNPLNDAVMAGLAFVKLRALLAM